ncbi:MAG: hypothetical protein ACFE0O_10855 [Opitutales bacterium]
MFKHHTTSEVNRLELALEQAARPRRFNGIIWIFWGLIFTKCFLVEYGSRVYSTGVDTATYVWSFSITMGILCTLVYSKLTRYELLKRPISAHLVNRIWLGCLIALMLLAVANKWIGGIDGYLLPGIYALILGIGFFIHGVLDRRKPFQLAALGWWAGALGLFALNDVRALGLFAGLIILCQILPTAWIHWAERRNLPGSGEQPEDFST